MPPAYKDKTQKPTANEWGKLRACLARLGFSQAQVKAAIGSTNNRTRGEKADALIKWIKEQ